MGLACDLSLALLTAAARVVAKAIALGLKERKRRHFGHLLCGIGASRLEGHRDVVAALLGRIFKPVKGMKREPALGNLTDNHR